MAKTLSADAAASARAKQEKRARQQLGHNTWRKAFAQHYWLYILMIPGILYMLIFNYAPMFGLIMAFEDFSPYNGNSAIGAMLQSPKVGFQNFISLFTGPDFWRLLRNTLAISFANLLIAFPAAIILSLLFNELRCKWFKRLTQTIVYIPHFVSIVIVASLTFQLFSTTDGFVYHLLVQIFGRQNAPDVLSDPDLFVPLMVGQSLWKETGYNTIIYLAALSSVDTQLYEAGAYLLLFILLMYMYWRRHAEQRPGLLLGVFFIGTFLSRFFIEFVKNDQVAFEAGMTFNMGQWLSIPFVAAGIWLVVRAMRRPPIPIRYADDKDKPVHKNKG